METTIIIVEDDEITALNLKLSLQKQGYKILAISNSLNDAIEKMRQFKPNIAIIDISLQDSDDGIELAKTIKSSFSIPFIFLTSYSDEDIISKAILTEPYGYIVKPFDPSSLHATIQMAIFRFDVENKRYKELDSIKIDEQNLNKLLYEKRESEKPIVYFGDAYHIDIIKDEIFHKDEKLKLTKKENAILKLLVAKKGEIVTFKQAINYVWKDNHTTDNSIRTLIWRLRTKLPTEVIKNASGIGYCIEY